VEGPLTEEEKRTAVDAMYWTLANSGEFCGQVVNA
jgi:hypothetical protein